MKRKKKKRGGGGRGGQSENTERELDLSLEDTPLVVIILLLLEFLKTSREAYTRHEGVLRHPGLSLLPALVIKKLFPPQLMFLWFIHCVRALRILRSTARTFPRFIAGSFFCSILTITVLFIF